MRLMLSIYRVWRKHAQRICAPGQWVVWRDETGVRVEVKCA